MISLITTYKNRLHHISQTLQTWINARPDEIVIVDYDSDDDISPVLCDHSNVIPITHVKCSNLTVFNLSHARNIGAVHASGECLFFVDIDTYLTPKTISLIQNLRTDRHYLAAVDSKTRKEIVNGGLLVVSKKTHNAICGFNEDMRGWGFEDIDYKRRLERHGLKYAPLGEDFYECIDHSDAERVQCYDQQKEISWTQNRQISLKTWKSKHAGQWKYIEIIRYGVT